MVQNFYSNLKYQFCNSSVYIEYESICIFCIPLHWSVFLLFTVWKLRQFNKNIDLISGTARLYSNSILFSQIIFLRPNKFQYNLLCSPSGKKNPVKILFIITLTLQVTWRGLTSFQYCFILINMVHYLFVQGFFDVLSMYGVYYCFYLVIMFLQKFFSINIIYILLDFFLNTLYNFVSFVLPL